VSDLELDELYEGGNDDIPENVFDEGKAKVNMNKSIRT